MRISMKYFLLIVLTMCALMVVPNVFSEENDPLVTQSYVEMRIEQIKEYIDSKIINNNEENVSVGSGAFKAIELKRGESIIGKEGCELILRSGKAKAIVNKEGGLTDVTAGIDIVGNSTSDSDIAMQHLIIIPRDDGRGIKVTSSNAFIMIKGDYIIK